MLNDEIKKISNPYDYSYSKLNNEEFIGRKKEIKRLRLTLENYKRTGKLKNVVIHGVKDIGKTALVHQFNKVLKDYNLYTYSKEIPRSIKTNYDEFEFFKEIIDQFFQDFDSLENTCLSNKQQEIWYNLIEINQDSSSYIDRELKFATKYYQKMQGINVTLSEKDIIGDFKKIMDAIITTDFEYIGFAIIIDEFQELKMNPIILDILRKLYEDLPSIMIIGSGLSEMQGNQYFEKFNSTAVNINLKPLTNIEIHDLIYNPLEIALNIERYELSKLFDSSTINEILDKSGGNPHHIKVLCAKIFDYFVSSEKANRLKINREVMDDVMDYYSSISENSRTIKNALETSSKDQLNIFKDIYFYEKLNIRAIILLKLAFDSIQKQQIDEIKKEIFNNLKEIYGLGIFKLHGVDDLSEIEEMSDNKLSQVYYEFIGDSIDKLYASYYFHDLTDKWLTHHGDLSFVDLLSQELGNQLSKIILKDELHQEINTDKIFGRFEKSETYENNITKNDFKKLEKLDVEKEEDIVKIKEISKRQQLFFPAVLANSVEINGYYTLIYDVIVRGKRRILYIYYPVKGNLDDLKIKKKGIIQHSEFTSIALDEYNIKINNIYLYWVTVANLFKVYIVNITDFKKQLFSLVRNRDFGKAFEQSEQIFVLCIKTKIKNNKKEYHIIVEDYNNFGFCCINVNRINKAEKIFYNLKDRYLLSKINLSYVYLLKNKFSDAKRILKKILKKNKNLENIEASFLHLAIMHKDLKNKNKIVEEVKAINVVAWNLSLIQAKNEDIEAKVNPFYNKTADMTDDEKIINRRVKLWIDYFLKNRDNLITKTESFYKSIKTDCYIKKDIKEDLKIFKKDME